MTRSLRIIVADDEQFMLNYYQEILPALGHEVVCAAQTGHELIEKCKATNPDLIITDIKMPDMDGIDAVKGLSANAPVPAILVSAYYDDDLIRRAEADHIMAFLTKPIKQQDLATTIALTLRRFEQFQALRKESADLKQALEDRKVIERAKGLLMKKANLDEQSAFRRLQYLARDNNKKLVEIANTVLLAEQAFQPPDKPK
jgi:AmiR/NasT family two-component response regulator